MASVESQHLVELETLLGPGDRFGASDDDDLESGPIQCGQIFTIQQPPTAIQKAIDLVIVQSTKRAARWAACSSAWRYSWRTIGVICQICLTLFVIIVAITPIFFPSYSHPPKHYAELRQRTIESSVPGRGNVDNQKVFIAASVYDGDGSLAGGTWGERLLELVDILGPDNVFLSIYEDNAGPDARDALDALSLRVSCNKSMIAEPLDLQTLPHVTLADGQARVRRVAFLAEVRNRALRPLSDTEFAASGIAFDKLLYLNDVIFDPVDAANLLFSTNVDGNGQTQYRAACALDFDNPFKFYDTFASRDLEGYEMGVIVYPWFANVGASQSRNDILEQKDAVRVRSCWGGMTAFEAKWFQPQFAASGMSSTNATRQGLQFRAEDELYWESSECCLIHADLQAMDPRTEDDDSTDIYMNPYIRVAYSELTHRWLPFARHFERILEPIQKQLNFLSHRPPYNPRRLNIAGQNVTDRVWSLEEGQDQHSLRSAGGYQDVDRVAAPGGLCGMRKLSVLSNADDIEHGYGRWWGETVPYDSHK